jgi:DNA (cytosine-5)-methyltransferase 1
MGDDGMIPAAGSVFEVCCGAGGMAAGFAPFFDIVHAVDLNPQVVQTYSANHQDTDVRQKDIRLLSGIRGDYDGITGVIGGPPCQGASIINTKRNEPDVRNTLMGEYREEDPRNALMGEFMRLVTEIKPRFFVMENVPSVPKEKKESVIRTGKEAGYEITSVYLNAAEYGAAQTRKRWIVVGIRGSGWTAPARRSPSTVRQAFTGINENWGVMQSGPTTLETLTRATDEWTAMSGKFRNMIRLSWDRPAPAVVNLKKVYMVHPGENRNISLAEAASLQGFPAAYQWKGNESQIAQMIANAMPAQLAEAIAGSLVS